jgi:agmatine deiminase
MISRRQFILASSAVLGGTVFRGTHGMADDGSWKTSSWRMPDEAAPHRCTWMAFGPDEEVWDDLLDEVRKNLAAIAKAISRFEPVMMLVRPDERKLAAKLCGDRVTLIEADLDDLWIRDSGPTFVLNDQHELGAVDLNFNGWGNKQHHELDATVAERIATIARATRLTTDLVSEGGGIEVDGAGTAIVTESCMVNDNRNPTFTKSEIESTLKSLLGLRKIIWLPGIRGQDITDGHTDFYARFARAGVVVAGLEMDRKSFDYEVTRKHLEILNQTTDAHGRKLEVVTLESPRQVRQKFRTED